MMLDTLTKADAPSACCIGSLRILLHESNLGDFSDVLIASGITNIQVLRDSLPGEIADIIRANARPMLPMHHRSLSELITRLNQRPTLPSHDMT